MTDRRLLPANGRVAAAHLRDQVTAPRYEQGQPASLGAAVADLLRAPEGARDRQLLHGAALTVYDRHQGFAFVRAEADGYVGYVAEAALAPACEATHRVSSRATHAYRDPDLKSPDLLLLSLGARVRVTARQDRFCQTQAGWVPEGHLAPIETPEADPVAVAQRLLGTPYLWGGNSALGIDCSGLVQAALLACGLPCPGDSDQQEAALGQTLPAGSAPERGDLLFWKGHVALVSDPQTLLHANAFHMAVAREPLAPALSRIETTGGGAVTRHARLTGVL